MSPDPWIVLAGHLQALAIGGRPTLTSERREVIRDAVAAAWQKFEAQTAHEPTRCERLLLAVAEVVAWDRLSDHHLRLLIAAVEIERDSREEIKHIEAMIPVANSARFMKGARE